MAEAQTIDPATWGRLGHLTTEQEEILQSCKQTLSEELSRHSHIDDIYVLRFLRARGFDEAKGTSLLQNHIAFYEENDLDNIFKRVESSKSFEALKTFIPACYHKCDTAGSPVYVDRLGAIDPKGVLRRFSEAEVLDYHLYLNETGRRLRKERSEALGKKIETSISIYDVKGLGIQHSYKPGLDLLRKSIAMDERNYPETMRKIYVVNTPTIFNMLWGIVKPWLNPVTLAKIEILGYQYKEKLIEEIGEENLPVEYGGKCECQGGCLPRGGPVSGLTSEAEPHKINVPRMSKKEVVIEVKEEVSSIAWEFVTQDYDISFGVFFEDSEGKRTEVEPIQKADSHLRPVQGSIAELKKPGSYVLVFDNTASYLRSKDVDYHIFVE